VAAQKLLYNELTTFLAALIVLKLVFLVKPTALCNTWAATYCKLFTWLQTCILCLHRDQNQYAHKPSPRYQCQAMFLRRSNPCSSARHRFNRHYLETESPWASISAADTSYTPANRTPIAIASWLCTPHLTYYSHDGWILI